MSIWTALIQSICSYEHESISASSLGTNIAQINPQTSAAGTELMDPALKTLKAALEAIREMATNSSNQLEQSQEQRSMRWKCKDCRYVKHFTMPVPLEITGRCPRCKSTEFRPIL
jgi:predicted Zn-ribbon and HTH transcriptional regulator